MQLRLRNSDFINRSRRDANEFPASNTQPSPSAPTAEEKLSRMESVIVNFRPLSLQSSKRKILSNSGLGSEHVHGEIKLEGGHNLESFDFFGLKGPITKYFFLNTTNC